MADLPVTPLADFGTLMGNEPQTMSGAANQYANVNVEKQQAQGLALQNQFTRMKLAFLNSQLAQMPGLNDSAPRYPGAPNDYINPEGTTLEEAGIDPQSIAAHAQQQYAVKENWTPDEERKLQLAPIWGAMGVPGQDQVAMQMHAARMANLKGQAQLGADQAYQLADKITKPGVEGSFSRLQWSNPKAAAALQNVAEKKGMDESKLDQLAYEYAGTVASSTWQYAGREGYVGKDGQLRDKLNDRVIPNGNPEGLSPEQYAKGLDDANSPVQRYINGQLVTKTKAEWMNMSPGHYVGYMAHLQRVEQARTAGVPSPDDEPQQGAPGTQGATPPPVPGSSPATAGNPGGGIGRPPAPFDNSQFTPDQQKFLNTSTKDQPNFLNSGTGAPKPVQEQQQKKYEDKYDELYTEFGKNQALARQQMLDVNRSLNLMAKNPYTGPGWQGLANMQNLVAKMLPSFFSDSSHSMEDQASIMQALGK